MARRTSNPLDRAPWGEDVLGPGDATFLQFAHAPCLTEVVEFLITLVDVSPSMLTTDLDPYRLAVACRANGQLITTKATKHPRDVVGVITFGGEARLRHRPVTVGDHAQSLLRSLKDLGCVDWTNFNAALTLAESVLLAPDKTTAKLACRVSRVLAKITGEDSRPASGAAETSAAERSVKRIVLLSDGERTKGPSPVAIAERLKARGVVIDCIGIADRDKVDEAALKAIASKNPDGSARYRFIKDGETLIRKYESLAGHIRPVEE